MAWHNIIMLTSWHLLLTITEIMSSISDSVELRPLDELGVGKCGQLKGRRNRTADEKQLDLEQRRRWKNARERQRVENVKYEYAKLQTVLESGSGRRMKKSTRGKTRHCKLRILIEAAKKIQCLLTERNRLAVAAGAGSPRAIPPRPPMVRHLLPLWVRGYYQNLISKRQISSNNWQWACSEGFSLKD